MCDHTSELDFKNAWTRRINCTCVAFCLQRNAPFGLNYDSTFEVECRLMKQCKTMLEFMYILFSELYEQLTRVGLFKSCKYQQYCMVDTTAYRPFSRKGTKVKVRFKKKNVSDWLHMLVCVTTTYVLYLFNIFELTIDNFQRYTYVYSLLSVLDDVW